MAHRNVLLYTTDTIFEGGISSLLSNEERVHLNICQVTDVTDLLNVSKESQPDVIVAEHDLLETHNCSLGELLDSMHGSCLIVLDKNHNNMHVYAHSDIAIRHVTDLIDAILSHSQG